MMSHPSCNTRWVQLHRVSRRRSALRRMESLGWYFVSVAMIGASVAVGWMT